MQDLRSRLDAVNEHLAGRGFDVRKLTFDPPATVLAVDAFQTQLGIELPPSFWQVLTMVSGHVEFRWFVPKGLKFPPPFRSNFCGDLHWSMEQTACFVADVAGWVANVFPNQGDPYDSVWHNKLPFFEVGNGDYLAFDLTASKYEQIVYLSHDDGEGHGYVLADNMLDLLDRWIPLACPGGEDWQWLPFTTSPTSRIDPLCDNGTAWKEILGLSGA